MSTGCLERFRKQKQERITNDDKSKVNPTKCALRDAKNEEGPIKLKNKAKTPPPTFATARNPSLVFFFFSLFIRAFLPPLSLPRSSRFLLCRGVFDLLVQLLLFSEDVCHLASDSCAPKNGKPDLLRLTETVGVRLDPGRKANRKYLVRRG